MMNTLMRRKKDVATWYIIQLPKKKKVDLND